MITRDTSAEAWAEADRLLAGIDREAIERVQAGLRRSESEGQRRMLELHGGRMVLGFGQAINLSRGHFEAIPTA